MEALTERARARAKAILNADATTGREALATHLADSTDLGVEAAIAVLAAAPVEPHLGGILRNYRAATGQ